MGARGRANGASSEADSCEHLSHLLQMLERQTEREKERIKRGAVGTLFDREVPGLASHFR